MQDISDFAFVVPIQNRKKTISKFVVSAFDSLDREIILYSGNDIEKSSSVFTENTGKCYRAVSWSIDHEASFEGDDDISLLSYLKNIIQNIKGYFYAR